MIKKVLVLFALSFFILSFSSCDNSEEGPRVPSISGLSPSGWVANSVDFLIIVTGQDFTSDTVILFDNIPIATTYVSATTLNGVVPNGLTKQATVSQEIGNASLEDKQIYVKVQNSVGTSEQRGFTFYDNWNFPTFSNVNSGEPVLGLDVSMTQDSQGVLYAVWTHLIYTASGKAGASVTGAEIRFARSDNSGANWTAPQKINGNLSLTSFDYPTPEIMIGSNNALYVVFSRNDPEKYYSFIWITSSADGGNTWSEPAYVNPSSNNYIAKSEYFPSFYIEPVTKNIHNTWSLMSYGYKNAIYYSHSLYQYNAGINGISETFSQPVRISNYTNVMQGESTVIANSTGDVHICWYQGAYNDFYTKELWVASSTNSGIDFGEPKWIADKTQINQCWPMLDITVDPQGNVYVVYVGPFNGTISDIMYQKSPDHGATYSSPISLTGSTGTCLKPFITSDSLGNLTLIYQEVANNMATIYSRRSTDGGSSFSVPVVVGTVNLPPSDSTAFNKPPYAASDFYPRYAPMPRVHMTMMNKPLLVCGNYNSRVIIDVIEETYELYSLLYSLGTGER
jgi:hypothetical protein